jgi:hypothetical protein
MRARIGWRGGAGRCLAVLAAAVVGGLTLVPAGPARAAAPGGSSGPAPAAGEWWLSNWNAQKDVWPYTQGSGVTVAVIDSGVQASVSDLRGAVVPGTVIGGSGNGEQDTDIAGKGHGTQMASLIAGRGGTGVVGVAPEATILPVSIGASANEATGPSLSTLATAINYAVGRGAQVISMSITGASLLGEAGVTLPCSGESSLQAAVDNAVARNVVLVASAGNNDEEDGAPVAPADCPGVVAVGGAQQSGMPDTDSDAQPYVAVSAPMDNLESQGRDGRLYHISGTSGAAALVAGEAALIRSRYPRMPWNEVVARMATQVTDPPGWPKPGSGYGFGIVDPAQAVQESRYPADAIDPVGQNYEYEQQTELAYSVQNAGTDVVTSGERVGRIELAVGALLLINGILLLLTCGLSIRKRRRQAAQAADAPPQAAYGPASAPHQPYPYRAPAPYTPPARGGRAAVVGVTCGVLSLVVAIVLGVIGWSPAQSPSLAGGVLGASACVTAGSSSAASSSTGSSSTGSGSLRLVTPPTLCGLPRGTVAADASWIIPAGVRQNLQSAGAVSSQVSAAYTTPTGFGAYRQIVFAGFTGSFNPEKAVQAFLVGDTAIESPAAGPHGGAADCYQSADVLQCAWATKTTAGVFWLVDSTNYEPASLIGSKVYAANFTRIRDALEVSG